MKLIKADHDRQIEIPGVPDPVKRPVDIDASRTGFANLRSLRIYRFEVGSTVNGHAEEDEVLVVLLAGSVEFTVSGDGSGQASRAFTLSAAKDSQKDSCLAYLPPHAAYRLIPKSDAEVAYARATPPSGPPAKAFEPQGLQQGAGITLLLEEKSYSERLGLRLVQIEADKEAVDFSPIEESEAVYEALVHVRTMPARGAASMQGQELDSWDTVAINPGELPTLQIAEGCSAVILVVLAL